MTALPALLVAAQLAAPCTGAKLSGTFAVVMFAKQLDAQAAASIAESVKLEQQEAPQREADRTKKVADDLEGERQKNIKTLRP